MKKEFLEREIRDILFAPECPKKCKCLWCRDVKKILALIERAVLKAVIIELKDFAADLDYPVFKKSQDRIAQLEKEIDNANR